MGRRLIEEEDDRRVQTHHDFTSSGFDEGVTCGARKRRLSCGDDDSEIKLKGGTGEQPDLTVIFPDK